MDAHDGLAGQAGQQPGNGLRPQRLAGRHPFGRAQVEPCSSDCGVLHHWDLGGLVIGQTRSHRPVVLPESAPASWQLGGL
jgi:hypothetical protein